MIYSKEFFKRTGKFAIGHDGRPMMKCMAILAEKSGRKIKWQDKPGWVDGELKDPKIYNEWIKNVKF